MDKDSSACVEAHSYGSCMLLAVSRFTLSSMQCHTDSWKVILAGSKKYVFETGNKVCIVTANF